MKKIIILASILFSLSLTSCENDEPKLCEKEVVTDMKGNYITCFDKADVDVYNWKIYNTLKYKFTVCGQPLPCHRLHRGE